MDINEVRQILDQYLKQKLHYSGEIEETNKSFQIIITKHSYSKPRPERNNEEIEIRTRSITSQVFENLTRTRLHNIIEELMDEFN